MLPGHPTWQGQERAKARGRYFCVPCRQRTAADCMSQQMRDQLDYRVNIKGLSVVIILKHSVQI